MKQAFLPEMSRKEEFKMEQMKLEEIIVALNSLQWELDKSRNIKRENRDYYANVAREAQLILLDLDR